MVEGGHLELAQILHILVWGTSHGVVQGIDQNIRRRSPVSVVRSWEFSQNLGFWDINWDHFLDFGKFPKPTKVWEF